MTIISYNPNTTGLQGVSPNIVQLTTTDNLATVSAAGYLNKQGQVLQGLNVTPTSEVHMIYSYSTATNSGTFGVFLPSFSAGIITLVPYVDSANVLLPVVDGDFATFNGTTGQIKDAGYLPSNAAKTVVVMANGATTTNGLVAFADTTGTIKNPSATTTTGFGITAATGSFIATAGNLIAGNTAGGNNALLQLFPTTATTGSIRWISAANGGNFNVDFTNASHGQATVYTIADIGAATGGIPVATTAIKVKSVAGAAAAGGAAAQSFTDTFCTTGSNVIGNWNTQANAVSVLKIVPGNGSFVVTSSGDAGVGTFNYIITK